jgi:hypothetical protein
VAIVRSRARSRLGTRQALARRLTPLAIHIVVAVALEAIRLVRAGYGGNVGNRVTMTITMTM